MRIRCGALVVVMLILAGIAVGQEKPMLPGRQDQESSNAAISGHIKLPGGRTVTTNIKVILSKTQSPLMTIYSDNNGEFIFNNLQPGRYYVQVLADSAKYEPLTQQLLLYPGDTPILTFYLVEKRVASAGKAHGATVTASEAASSIPSGAVEEYDRAHKLTAKNDIEGAISHFQRAIEIYPAYLVARNDLGVQYLKLRRLKEAAEQFEAAIATEGRYFNARLNLGIVHVEEKSFNEAIEQLNQAIMIDSSHPGPHLFLGIASLETDDLPTAEKELVKALVLGGPEYSKAHYYFAHVYMKCGKPDDALRELNLFLKTAGTDEMANQARLLVQQLSRR